MKKSINRLVAVFVAAMVITGLTACTGINVSKPDEQAGNVGAGETTVSYPMTITDSNGIEITIKEEPETIISAAPNVTEIIYALGVGDKVVARSDYCDYPKEVTEVESIGSIRTPDIERIVELTPDLVIASTHFSEENAVMLEKMDIPVLTLYEGENFDGSYALIQKMGMVLNCEKEAAELIEGMKAVVDEITLLVKEEERPSVYYVVSFGEYGDYTAGGNTFIGQMLEMAGGNNIASDIEGWAYNLESLLEADPDIIILSNQYDTKAEFESTGSYSELTAVKEGRVYEIDNNMLDRQGVRNAEGLKVLAKILHPEIFR